jgi:hypothetical protein
MVPRWPVIVAVPSPLLTHLIPAGRDPPGPGPIAVRLVTGLVVDSTFVVTLKVLEATPV